MFLSSWTSLFFEYSFNETYHVLECWFIQKISSFFSLRVLCAALFWNLGFFISQIVFLIFRWTKATPYVSSSLTYFPWFENSLCVDFFGGLFLSIKYGRGFASPLMHTWLIESEVLPCLSHLVIISCNSCLLLSSADGQMYYGVIFPHYT